VKPGYVALAGDVLDSGSGRGTLPGDRFIELATAEDRRVLDILFRHTSEGVTVQDRSGQLVYANDEAARLVGGVSGAELMRTPSNGLLSRLELIDTSGAPMPVDSLPGRRVLAGAPMAEAVVGYRRPGSPRTWWSRVRSSPIRNDAGEVVLVLSFFHDITSQFRRDEVRELLYNVYEALGSSLDRDENLRALTGVLVPRMGPWCAVHLIEGGVLFPVAIAHPDDESARTLIDLAPPRPISMEEKRLQPRVARTGRPEILEITEEVLEKAGKRLSPETLEVFRRLALNSVACVPITIGRRVIGTLSLGRGDPEPMLDDADLDVLGAVADRAAAALENAGLYQQQREIAEALQAVLTPKKLPSVPGVETAARYRPVSLVGHVGGDFYDVFPAADGRTALLVGDIAGKGIEAAAAVGMARYTLRSNIALDPKPSTVLTRINESLLEEEQMCTLAYALIEDRGERFQVSVTLAGHPPPIVVRAGGATMRLGTPCPPLGVLAEIDPIEEESVLEPGDLILLYTDGFAMPGLAPPESVELALTKCMANDPEALLDQLLAVLWADLPAAGQRDDIAMVAMRASHARAEGRAL
jgi:serine phosphatase RsbU (regulator of sigma subunit)